MKSVKLQGACAVVSGATSDIGAAICRRFAQSGAGLRLIGRSIEKLDQLADELAAYTSDIATHAMDLADPESIETAVAGLRSQTTAVDCLVHSAGAFAMGALDSTPQGDLDLQYWTNVRGPLLLTQQLMPQIKSCKGQLVFINSTLGVATRADTGSYASTQHALKAMTDTLRHEVNADGVRVLSVFLGRTASARQAGIFAMEGRAYRPELLVQPEDVAEIVCNTVQLPRTAEVTDIHVRPLIKSY